MSHRTIPVVLSVLPNIARSTIKRLAFVTGLSVLLLGSFLTAAQADRIRTTNCVYGPGSYSCITVWQRTSAAAYRPKLWTPRLERAAAQAAERERLWTDRCQPKITRDEFGVGRYSYAAPGCAYGVIE
jgi:hypothetical protein